MDQNTPLVVYVLLGAVPGFALLFLAVVIFFAGYGGDPKRLNEEELRRFRVEHQEFAGRLAWAAAACNSLLLILLLAYWAFFTQ